MSFIPCIHSIVKRISVIIHSVMPSISPAVPGVAAHLKRTLRSSKHRSQTCNSGSQCPARANQLVRLAGLNDDFDGAGCSDAVLRFAILEYAGLGRVTLDSARGRCELSG